MPFERTALPGLTVVGEIEAGAETVDISTLDGWAACVDESIRFPMGLADDVFLHVSCSVDQGAGCVLTASRSASALSRQILVLV